MILIKNAILVKIPRRVSISTGITFLPKELWTAIGRIHSDGDGKVLLFFPRVF